MIYSHVRAVTMASKWQTVQTSIS